MGRTARNVVRETLRHSSQRGCWQSDTMAPDETRAQIMALAANAGLSRIGFVRDPTSGPQP
jgi:hypothetical protein